MYRFIYRAVAACGSFVLMALCMPAHAFAEDCVKDHSQAWCLLDLAGHSHGAHDIKIEKANEILAKASPNVNPADGRSSIDMGSVVIAAMDYAKLTHLPPGISSGFSGTMWLLSALTSGPKAGESNQAFVILPESEVKNGDPLATAEDAFVAAVVKYLEAEGAEKVDEERNPPLGSRYTIRAYKVSTGKCAAVPGGCWISADFFRCSNCSAKKPMVIDKLPEWLGVGRSFVWRSWSTQILEAHSKGKPIFPYDQLYQGLRVLLPDSFYFYRPGELSLLFNGQNARMLAN